jgi:hypothetical protein
MANRNRSIGYGLTGACFGIASLASAAGPCRTGDCSACLQCLGVGVALAVMALVKRAGKEVAEDAKALRK